MQNVGDLLSTAEVAARLDVSVATVTRWVKAGRLNPAVKGAGLRGSMFFFVKDVDALETPVA